MQFTQQQKNHTHPFENLSKPAHDENNLGDAAFQPYKNLQKFLNEPNQTHKTSPTFR